MFVIKQPAEYYWPVSFKVPVDDGTDPPEGEDWEPTFAEFKFHAKLKRLETAAAEALAMEVAQYFRAAEVGFFPDDMRRPPEMAADVLVGWRQVDEDFTAANKKKALAVHGCAVAVLAAWQESLSGGRRKN
jgi:hypothetical protein